MERELRNGIQSILMQAQQDIRKLSDLYTFSDEVEGVLDVLEELGENLGAN
jgi:hypothetical protein